MSKPDIKQFGVTEEQCESIFAKKKKILNYTFGISSAAGIVTGSIIGIYLSKGIYEAILFVLFFGCFLGSLFGAVFTILTIKVLLTLLLYFFSPAYKSCRKYMSAVSGAESNHP
jgi:Na+-driven multidrug efflux pump